MNLDTRRFREAIDERCHFIENSLTFRKEKNTRDSHP
jgi:hypothetical protein